MGISCRRAWQMFKDGKLPNARQLPTGIIVIIEDDKEKKDCELGQVCHGSQACHGLTVTIYSRVSSHENRDNLEIQADRLKEYALAKG
ncbi:MAG: hypothetical protein ACP5UF_06175, partial [Hydrogenobaculum sp.]